MDLEGVSGLGSERTGAGVPLAVEKPGAIEEPDRAPGWNIPAQSFSWSGMAVPEPARRKRIISLGKAGTLVFKSTEDAHGCRIETSSSTESPARSSLTLEPAAVGNKLRLLLPLTIHSKLCELPAGATATFSLTVRMSGTGDTKPVEWIALLARKENQEFSFWRKIAQEVDAGPPEVRSWRFTVAVGREEMPDEIHLAFQLRPDAGSMTFGDIRLAVESITTKAGALDVQSKSEVSGWLRSKGKATDAWLHAYVGADPFLRVKVSPANDLFALKNESERVRFSISYRTLAQILGGGKREWKLVLTDRGTPVAEATLDARRLRAVRDREVGLQGLKEADDQTLAKTLREIRNVELLSRARGHFKAKNWAGLLGFHRVLLGLSKEYQRLLTLVGRGALYANDNQVAIRLLGLGALTFPDDQEIQHYCGVAHAREGRHLESIPYFRAALRLPPQAIRTKKALASALRRAVRETVSPETRIDMLGEAADLLREVLEEEFTRSSAISLAEILSELGRNEDALQVTDELLVEGRDVPVLLLKARTLVALNRVGEALSIAEEVIEVDPLNQSARFHLRALRYLAQGATPLRPPTFGDLVRLPTGDLIVGAIGEAGSPLAPRPTSPSELADAFSRLPFDWLRIGGREGFEAVPEDLMRAIDSSSGFCQSELPGTGPTKLWRREAIVHLAESGLIGPDLSDLATFEGTYLRSRTTTSERPTVIVISRHGSLKFGGGEQFLESMAEHYRSIGYSPVIVGTRPELVGKVGEVNGVPFAFVDHSPASLRRLFLQSKAEFVHAISGVGFQVTEALSFTNIPFIYGVHYWREALGDDSDQGFFDSHGNPVPRPEFQYVLSRAASVYANSQYTRSILETAYGVRCPVIYSVPREVEEHHDD